MHMCVSDMCTCIAKKNEEPLCQVVNAFLIVHLYFKSLGKLSSGILSDLPEMCQDKILCS